MAGKPHLWQGGATAAETYDAHLVPVFFEPWAEVLIGKAGLRDGERVLDVACGTGAVTRAAAALRPGRLVGFDMNPGMLAVSRRRAAAAGIELELVEGDATALPFEDAAFDVVLCQQGMQFFPDRQAAADGFARVLADGGRAAVACASALEDNPLLEIQAELFGRHAGDVARQRVEAICGLPSAAELRRVFEAAGFRDVAVEKITLTLGHPDVEGFARAVVGANPSGDLFADLGAGPAEALVSDLVAGFAPLRDGAGISFPHVSHVVTAVR